MLSQMFELIQFVVLSLARKMVGSPNANFFLDLPRPNLGRRYISEVWFFFFGYKLRDMVDTYCCIKKYFWL